MQHTKSSSSFDGTEIAIASAKHVPTAKADVVAAWAPTKEWLEGYRIGGLESLCRQKGCDFVAVYETEHGEGAFAKLMKKRKAEIIKAIIELKFDWSEVAPNELTALVEQTDR